MSLSFPEIVIVPELMVTETDRFGKKKMKKNLTHTKKHGKISEL